MHTRTHLFGIASLALSICACSDSGTAPQALATTRDGFGALSVDLIDAPTDAQSVWVTIDQLQIRLCEGGGWTTVALQSTEFDLLTLTDGLTGVLSQDEIVPAGKYCELRLHVESPAKMLLESGEEVELMIPSGESSGLKIKGEFLVVPGLSTKVVLDFDAKESIHETGNHKFVMKPVVRIADVSHDSPNGHSFQGAVLKDFAVFSVDPDTEGVFSLPGGAQLAFQQGSVDQHMDFTVTMWEPELLGALSNTYAFSPSYDFLVDPVFSLPALAQKGAIRWDYEELPTAWSGGGPVVASASVPHFSCSGLGRFTGLPAGSWFSEPVIGLDLRGVLTESEFPDNYFDPTNGNASLSITRAEAVGIIVRAMFLQENPSTPSSFTDLGGNKFAKYIGFAESLGIIEGCDVPAKKFCPNKSINRAEFAKVAAKAMWSAGRKSIAATVDYYKTHSASPLYGDVTDQSLWYFPYVYAMRDVNVMRGSKVGGIWEFKPANPINRVEAAKTICYLAYGDNCLGCKVTKYIADYAAQYADINHDLPYGGANGNKFLDFDPNGTATDGGNCTNFASQSLRKSSPSPVVN